MTAAVIRFMRGSVPVCLALSLDLSLAASVGAGEPFRRLKGAQIMATLSGKELTDEVHWAYVFGKAGRLTSVSLGTRGTGTWHVRNDELCLDGGPDGRRCLQVWSSGHRVELRREGGLPDEGILQTPQARR
ncbi:hypothetical protein [Methylorubrum extorquens]|jgi:hypothetical protein|uniref:Uncharacterized protein n=3 Tax=Methylorubrum extorquens TaxID=408 RepID=B7KRI5_METC4|nr:hypothetical protein [Methylorubrum extorquens]ACK85512.1 conserved hypothetical protein [Methylorubrum extorquens CM4]EHP90738.1 hypothetical protein MetexDRAFT_4372 [Methylorubrum extorquens DSM 13060]WHQ69514.1 hypothetical protein KEC54_24770 [Methylorubrum extorquens]